MSGFGVGGGGKRPPGIPEDQTTSAFYEPFYIKSAATRQPPLVSKRSASPGILSKMGLAQPSLQISLAQDVFFLHPAPEGVPTYDEIIAGTVTLWLPKPRTLKHFTVRLRGLYDIGWNDSTPYESGICLEKTVSLCQEGTEVSLEKGEHTFEFILIVPSFAACYERCQYGRVRHSITAKAKGLGNIGGDIISPEYPVFLITNPGLAHESRPPPPLHLKFEGALEELGPYSMGLQSQHVMVGGLLLFRLSLLFPPQGIMIYSIKVKIIQKFHLQSPTNKAHESVPPPHSQTIFILDSAHPPNFAKVKEDNLGARSGSATPKVGPLKVLRKDEMWKIHHLARLPNDNHIRPSTHEGTKSPISVTHSIQMELTFRRLTEEEENPPSIDEALTIPKKGKDRDRDKEKEPERRKVVMSKPLDIFSCCCFLDSLTLPVYSLMDPNPTPLDAELVLPCVCGMQLKQLIDSHATALLIEGDDDASIEYIARPKRDEDGSSQPPTPTEERGRPSYRTGQRDNGAAAAPTSNGSTSGSGSGSTGGGGGGGGGGFFRNNSTGDRLFAMSGWRSPSTSLTRGRGSNSGTTTPTESRAGSRSASRNR
ncbi:uncharacterized protein JCM15063_005819 [Sporobolomyces koalae]|uniref:uncharacterized protein n=1 Tax=Sporobolomyces koalae TaxID=500713 RepID=UPI00317CBA4F